MRAPSLLMVAALIALAACKEAEGKDPTLEVTRGELVAEQSFHGELVAKKSIAVTVPKAPRLDVLTLKTVLADGTKVKAGDVVATFDTTELEENLRGARTELAIAQAERQKAEHALATEKIGLELEVKRRQLAMEEAKLRLVEGVNLISELERKKAEVQLRSAEVELKLAGTALDTFAKKRATTLEVNDVKVRTAGDLVKENEAALDKFSVKAPAEGVVYRPYVPLNYTRAKAEPGRVCRSGDKLLELPDLSVFEVVLQVRPRDAARVKVGDEAKVYVAALGDRVIAAKVASKEDFATTRNERYGTKTPEGNLKEIAVKLELAENPEGLRPGGTVRAELRSLLEKEAVLVPLAAIDDEKDGKATVILEGGEKRTITLGVANATHVNATEGVTGGEVLVLTPRAPARPPVSAR